MKKLRNRLMILVFLIVLTFPMTVSADIGPKPSVRISFEGLEKETYYVTLISEEDSTGPYTAGGGCPEYYTKGEAEAFAKFAEYDKGTDFYFLGYLQDCSETHEFAWTYYPPGRFRVVAYLPEYDYFLESEGISERYAFDSYFESKVSNAKNLGKENYLEAIMMKTRTSYDYKWELRSLAARIVLTIAVEFVLALFFGYFGKKPLGIIVGTNVFTQLVLNVLLNLANYKHGHWAFVFHFIWMEIVVFVLEGLIYRTAIGKTNPRNDKPYHPWRYALAANAVSFAVGLLTAKVIPGIF